MSVEEMVSAEKADRSAPVSFHVGVVEAVTDALHLSVMMGQTAYPVTVPSTLVGAAMVGSEVRVQVQDNSRVLDSVRTGAWIGEMRLWASATIPSGWLLCDGSSFSAATYPLLNTLLGGTTLPDLRDRFPVGKSGTKSLRSTGGSETITEAQLPAHAHGGVPQRTTATYVASYGATFHGITGSDVDSDDAGSGDDYWQPYYAVNYIIKAA